MKKLLRNIALLLLPIAMYFTVFVIFEPNNYFGVQKGQVGNSSVGVMRSYQQNPTNSVLLGDSRVAGFDMDMVREITGRPFSTLAYGGSVLRENLDMLDWALALNPNIDEIVFATSFYTMNKNYPINRFEALESSLNNPFIYTTNFSYNLQAMQNAVWFMQGIPLGGGAQEVMPVEDYIYVDEDGKDIPYPQFFIDYCNGYLSKYTSIWELDEDDVNRLIKTIEACVKRGINFTLVLPPMHRSMVDLVVEPNGIDKGMLPVLQKINASSAFVLDYEFESRLDFVDTQYFDGFHLEYNRGLPQWTKMLFDAVNKNHK